jgi:hypothetical protein
VPTSSTSSSKEKVRRDFLNQQELISQAVEEGYDAIHFSDT